MFGSRETLNDLWYVVSVLRDFSLFLDDVINSLVFDIAPLRVLSVGGMEEALCPRATDIVFLE